MIIIVVAIAVDLYVSVWWTIGWRHTQSACACSCRPTTSKVIFFPRPYQLEILLRVCVIHANARTHAHTHTFTYNHSNLCTFYPTNLCVVVIYTLSITNRRTKYTTRAHARIITEYLLLIQYNFSSFRINAWFVHQPNALRFVIGFARLVQNSTLANSFDFRKWKS